MSSKQHLLIGLEKVTVSRKGSHIIHFRESMRVSEIRKGWLQRVDSPPSKCLGGMRLPPKHFQCDLPHNYIYPLSFQHIPCYNELAFIYLFICWPSFKIHLSLRFCSPFLV